ncbi:hypothetical protein VSS92_30260, partial [Pseudomonas syringae pv. tagetis]
MLEAQQCTHVFGYEVYIPVFQRLGDVLAIALFDSGLEVYVLVFEGGGIYVGENRLLGKIGPSIGDGLS